MSNLTNRVKRLEQDHAPKVSKYMLNIMPAWADWDTPEEKAKGYKIQCCIPSFGGTGGAPFYLATWADVEAFAARDDVHLDIRAPRGWKPEGAA